MSARRGEVEVLATRVALEESCRARVRATKLWFEFAAAQAAQAARYPDSPALGQARAMELEARDEYMHALQIFADLVVRGKMPGDEASE